MSDAVPAGGARGIILAHGTLAEGFVDAVRQITGPDADHLTPISNRGMSPDTLAAELRKHISDAPTILFTDLPSGSCGFAARRLCPDFPNLAVISAINLPLLLDFIMHREEPLEALVPRLLAKGRGSLCCAPPALENHGHRVVSGG
jgi:mannose/fructose-specific phosphotransferase system component IIA